MNRQVWIRETAYDIARKIAFDQRKSIGEVISNAIENNVKAGVQ
jgi:hypothetical protein